MRGSDRSGVERVHARLSSNCYLRFSHRGRDTFLCSRKEKCPKETRPRKTPTPSLRFSPASALASTRRAQGTRFGLKHEASDTSDSCCDVKGFTNVASAGMRKSDRCSRGIYGGLATRHITRLGLDHYSRPTPGLARCSACSTGILKNKIGFLYT